MKQCTKCKEVKPLEEFNKDKSRKDGLRYNCKSCTNAISKKWYKNNPEKAKAKARVKEWYKKNPNYSKKHKESRKEGHFSIYLLEGTQGECGKGYVGQTTNLYYRMSDHKYNGKIFDRYTILDIAQTEEQALYLEAQYHVAGYGGANRRQKKLRDQIIEENKLKLIN